MHTESSHTNAVYIKYYIEKKGEKVIIIIIKK